MYLSPDIGLLPDSGAKLAAGIVDYVSLDERPGAKASSQGFSPGSLIAR